MLVLFRWIVGSDRLRSAILGEWRHRQRGLDTKPKTRSRQFKPCVLRVSNIFKVRILWGTLCTYLLADTDSSIATKMTQQRPDEDDDAGWLVCERVGVAPTLLRNAPGGVLTSGKDFRARTLTTLKNSLGKLWKSRSVTISEYDPTYKTSYLGNVLTGWAKGKCTTWFLINGSFFLNKIIFNSTHTIFGVAF